MHHQLCDCPYVESIREQNEEYSDIMSLMLLGLPVFVTMCF